MAVTAKFQADFASFHDAVQKAEVSLRGLESGAGKVSTSLNKMVDGFSGRKIIQDATLAAEAVERIGGVTKLTEAEQRKLNTTVTEALAKYKALGLEAPQNLTDIANATKKTDDASTQAGLSFGKMFSAFGLAGLATNALSSLGHGLLSLAKGAIDSAGAVVDLSNKTGLSLKTIQQFNYVAEQSGVSVDALTSSVFKLGTNLADNTTKARDAVQALGLDFERLRASSPDDAFNAVLAALESMPPSFDRNLAMQQLFGKGAQEVAKLVADGYTEMAGAAKTSSDDQIKALDRAGDAWVRFKKDAEASITGLLGTLVLAAEQAKKESIPALIASAALFGPDALIAQLATKNTGKTPPKDINLPVEIDPLKAYREELDRLKKSVETLTPVQRALVNDAVKLGQSSSDIAAGLHIAEESVRSYLEAQKRLAEAEKDAAKAMDERARAGVKSAKDWDQTVTQIDRLIRTGLKDWANDSYRALSATTEEAGRMARALSGTTPVVSGLSDIWRQLGPATDAGLKPSLAGLPKVRQGVGDIAKALTDLATVAGPSFAGLASGFATLINSARAASEAIKNIKSAAASFGEGAWKAGLLEMTSGVLGVVSAAAAAVNAVKALFNVFDRNKGRDAVEDFAKSFGGFDQLHAKLLELGDSGEALWVKLTQGVGRNNPEQAARVIAEVEAALARQAQAQEDVTGVTEEQAQATIETATQAAKALDELGPRLKQNADEWRSWGEIVTSQIQRIADGLRGMGLPTTPLAGTSSGTGVQSTGYAPVLGPDGQVIKVYSVLDGQVIATSTARAALGWA